jgi:glutamate dehydrogenase/leucine dehydrogenase
VTERIDLESSIHHLLKGQSLKGTRVAVQGFGNIGAAAASLLEQQSSAIVGAGGRIQR